MKDASYHEDAITYNRVLAEAAESLKDQLNDEEVSKWAVSVGKQHRFHEGRHTRALNKLQNPDVDEVDTEDGGEATNVSIAHQQAQYAAEQEAQNTDAAPDASQEAEPVAQQGA